MKPFTRQLLLASIMAIAMLAIGLYLSAINYLPALQSAFKITSITTAGRASVFNLDILIPAIGFLLSAICLHVGAYLLPLLAQRKLLAGIPEARDSVLPTAFSSLLLTIALFYLNEHVFPHSAANVLGLRTGAPISTGLGIFSLLFVSLILIAAAALTIWQLARHRTRITISLLAISIGMTIVHGSGTFSAERTQGSRPNIIMIGIDSLRPDHLFEHADGQKKMPELSAFLEDALVFTNASTVIGRSYPAWISVFSGQYPHISGIRYNLQSRKFLDQIPLLPKFLRENGYATVFATDETRFANIDETFGFDLVISPAQGFEDFLVIAFSDLPLVNLLSNTPIIERLLPIVSMNRQSRSYMESTFSRQLEWRLASFLSETDDPVFVVVDFDVAHYPYRSSEWNLESLFDLSYNAKALKKIPEQYAQAASYADRQFARLIRQLAKANVLDNAVTVIFSDHGENLGEGDSGYVNQTEHPIPFGMVGHGISIFDDWTHDVVLALKDSRDKKNAGATTDWPVEIVDIAPTLLSLLAIDTPNWNFSGQNLLEAKNPDRYRLRESGVRMPALMGDEIDEIAIAKEAMANYTVAEDGRLEMRPELHKPILLNKQRGLEINGVMLTYLPNPGERGDLYWVIVDRNTKEIFSLNDYPDAEHATRLMTRFCEVYSSDTYFPGADSDCESEAFGDGPPAAAEG